ncbi:MAG: hypothetical protein A4E57_04177 [Syntrophorhabdaceae bacterium PtaU1.Bin034]|nr:MAG: hypothetical protein A4E57_04177 [Syntrophorhabdaceae bacterium PtaU1.Bin034]
MPTEKRLMLILLLAALLCLSACAPAVIRTDPEPRAYPQAPAQYPEARAPYPQTRPAAPQSDLRRATIEKQTEMRKSVAKGIRDEAYGLQQRGLIREAVAKYRESLFYWPDFALDSYVVKLENTVKAPLPGASGQTQAPGAQTGPREMIAAVRNRSTGEVSMRLSEGGESREVLFQPGEIRELAIRTSPSGEITAYVLQGGRTVAGRKWLWNSGDPSLVPAILYDDKEPESLILMKAMRTR